MQVLPQLDISTYSSQIFWLVIFFGILYLFISKLFVPKMKQIFLDRDNLLSSLDVKIKRIRGEIDLRSASNDKVIRDAKFAAQAIVAEAVNVVSRIKSDSLLKFSNELGKIHQESLDKIDDFKSKSKDEMKRVIFNISMKYYGLIFTNGFSDKVVDFSIIRQFITKKIEENIIKH